jgi:hypothetical protein
MQEMHQAAVILPISPLIRRFELMCIYRIHCIVSPSSCLKRASRFSSPMECHAFSYKGWADNQVSKIVHAKDSEEALLALADLEASSETVAEYLFAHSEF